MLGFSMDAHPTPRGSSRALGIAYNGGHVSGPHNGRAVKVHTRTTGARAKVSPSWPAWVSQATSAS